MSLGRFGSPQKSRELKSPGDECPQCGKLMRIRHRKDRSGSFLGCSGYPDCRYTESEYRDPEFGDKQPSLFDKGSQQGYKAKLNPHVAGGVQSAPPQWPNQGLMLTEQQCRRLLDRAQDKLEDNKDTEMMDIICKLEKYCTTQYRKAKWEGEPTAEDLVPTKVNDVPQEEF